MCRAYHLQRRSERVADDRGPTHIELATTQAAKKPTNPQLRLALWTPLRYREGMKNTLETWWSERSRVEKVAVTIGASALGVGIGCAVAMHGLVIVTPKAIIALGPVAKTIAKAASTTALVA